MTYNEKKIKSTSCHHKSVAVSVSWRAVKNESYQGEEEGKTDRNKKEKWVKTDGLLPLLSPSESLMMKKTGRRQNETRKTEEQAHTIIVMHPAIRRGRIDPNFVAEFCQVIWNGPLGNSSERIQRRKRSKCPPRLKSCSRHPYASWENGAFWIRASNLKQMALFGKICCSWKQIFSSHEE